MLRGATRIARRYRTSPARNRCIRLLCLRRVPLSTSCLWQLPLHALRHCLELAVALSPRSLGFLGPYTLIQHSVFTICVLKSIMRFSSVILSVSFLVSSAFSAPVNQKRCRARESSSVSVSTSTAVLAVSTSEVHTSAVASISSAFSTVVVSTSQARTTAAAPTSKVVTTAAAPTSKAASTSKAATTKAASSST